MNPGSLISNRARLAAALVGMLFGGAVFAADKTAHGWSNPTPRESLRELSSDRPDATESPFTVDAGHVQFEFELGSYARDRHNPARDDTRVSDWNVGGVNIRTGLSHDLELQIVIDNYLRTKTESPSAGVRELRRGFGDVTLRLKRNLRGNDGGDTALAVMPFLKLPTNSDGLGNRHVEGGVILPFGFSLGGWGAGAMTEVDVVRNAADDGYTLRAINTATVARGFTERTGAFFELASEAGGGGGHVLTFNTGVTYAVTADLQWDAGVNLGLSRSAPDLRVFTGLVVRF